MKFLFAFALLVPGLALADEGPLRKLLAVSNLYCAEKGAAVEAYDLQSNPKEMSPGEEVINDCSECTNPEEKRDGSVKFEIAADGMSATGAIQDPGNTHLTFEAYDLKMNFRLAIAKGNVTLETKATLFRDQRDKMDRHELNSSDVVSAKWIDSPGEDLRVHTFTMKGVVPTGFNTWSDAKKTAFEKKHYPLYAGDFTEMQLYCYFRKK